MQQLTTLFVGKPLSILAVALVFLAAHFAKRRTGSGSGRHPRSLLVAAFAWAVYAAWEWLVLARTPGANIRVDLLVIWPILIFVSLWFSIRAFR